MANNEQVQKFPSQRRYWLAVISKANCDALASMGYPYYALRTPPKVASGDVCALYRSGNGGGFIGAFEFVDAGASTPIRLADTRAFSFQLRWRVLALCEAAPVPIAPMIESLELVSNKKNYGMALRSTFRSISKRDYSMIETRIREAAAHSRS